MLGAKFVKGRRARWSDDGGIVERRSVSCEYRNVRARVVGESTFGCG